MFAEQIKKLKEIGIDEPDNVLQALLSKNFYNIASSIADYYDNGAPLSKATSSKGNNVRNSSAKYPPKKALQNESLSKKPDIVDLSENIMPSGVPPTTESSLGVKMSKEIALKSDPIVSTCIFIGRRSVLGYTRSRGFLLRNQSVKFILEGENSINKKKAITAQSEMQPKSKFNYSAMNGKGTTTKSYINDKFSGGIYMS